MPKPRQTRSTNNRFTPMKQKSAEKSENSKQKRENTNGEGQDPYEAGHDEVSKTQSLSELKALEMIEEIFKKEKIEVLDQDDTLSKVKEKHWFSYSQESSENFNTGLYLSCPIPCRPISRQVP